MTNDELINDEIIKNNELMNDEYDIHSSFWFRHSKLFPHFPLLAGSRINIFNGIGTGFVIRNCFIILISLFFILSTAAFAGLETGGYYENTLIVVGKRTGGGTYGDLNRLRLRIDSNPLPHINVHLEPEFNLMITTEAMPLIDASKLNRLIWDRAYLRIYFPLADLTVGRQRIAWGAGYIWNPTDVFNPFTLSFAQDEEEESEPEAVRLQIPLGALSVIDAFTLTGKEWEEAVKGVRIKANMANYDLSLSYVDKGTDSFQYGFDATGELFGLGVRSEIALIYPAAANSYVQSVWGWNYTFENGWFIDMEYFFNGLGKKNQNDYDWAGLFAGDIYLLGMDYLYLGLNKRISEIQNIKVSFYLNANDKSFILYPAYGFNIAENVDLSLEAMFPDGEDGSEYKPIWSVDPSGLIGSNILYLKLRFSF